MMEESRDKQIEQEMPKTYFSKDGIFDAPTPEKTREQSRKQIIQFSEKHTNLLESFNRLTTSLRLLSLSKRSPTFQNVSRQIEIMTGRKFLALHLAQIKYILPEALKIDKFLIHDEQTKCVVPSMKIELLFDVVEYHGEESPFVALNNLFSSRLKEFCLAHPEDSDVPEAVLPEPFNQKSVKEEEPIPKALSFSSETEIQTISHFSPSFTKRFCQEAVATNLEKTRLTSDTKPVSVANSVDESSIVLPDSYFEAGKSECTPTKRASSSNNILAKTPVHLIAPEMEKTCLTSDTVSVTVATKGEEKSITFPDSCFEAGKSECTPTKLASSSNSILTKTLVHLIAPEIEKTCLTSDTQSVTVATKGEEKSITFPDSSFEAGKSECTPIKLASGNNSILVETPVQSTPMRSIPPNTSVLTCEDENKATLSQNCKKTPSTVKKSLHFNGMENKDSYEQESVGLSDLVPLIHQIFRSSNFCPITKEELVHKIIMFNCDADDRSKVETQMEHLEKLVPDWFSKKLAPSGDLLYNVKKAADLNSVCERINVK